MSRGRGCVASLLRRQLQESMLWQGALTTTTNQGESDRSARKRRFSNNDSPRSRLRKRV